MRCDPSSSRFREVLYIVAFYRKYTRGLTFETQPLLEKAAERKAQRARAAALKKQGTTPGESSAPLSKLRSRARGQNVQDVLGTPPDTPVHIIIPDHELAFEWLAPKGGEAGRDVDVPGVVWETERERERERLEGQDGDEAVGEEGMGVKEGGLESIAVLEGGGGLAGVYSAQQGEGGGGWRRRYWERGRRRRRYWICLLVWRLLW